MKPIYNVFANTRGVRSWGEDVHSEFFDGEDVAVIETPSCFLRVRKTDLTRAEYIKHIQSHFALFRQHPSQRYHNTVQWSTKRGQWVNGATFSSPEEAQRYVREQNAKLIPFASSPYLVYELAEVCDEN